MKINWGTGIALFYGLFMLVMISAVLKTKTYDHSLVSDHYYQDDLNYQKHYDKLVNTQRLNDDLAIVLDRTGMMMKFDFPADMEKVNGEIQFFCPSDSKKDFYVTIGTNAENEQWVPVQTLKKGLWKVKVNWSFAEEEFYKEDTFNF